MHHKFHQSWSYSASLAGSFRPLSLLIGSLFALCFFRAAPCEDLPILSDNRLELQLFAETPDIVTPIGLVIDQHDHIYVIESHTHHPPSNYDGPKSDRIKVFVDRDDDGAADQISVFADGIQQAMNLAISPDGVLYVVCTREVIRLTDEDHDGRCDKKESILKLVTRERYAHNSLLGLTFDRDGWMYVARGNVGSHHYRFEGQDETTVEGYGDGGNVVRCRPDGTALSEFATGFWNPFDLKFDRNGRLLLVDNDPDARGPNRLVHVVQGGDYGYKSVYGGSGNHPFQGWDGTLPGTLPFIAGTGEAPCGLIDCRRSSFPNEYANSVLVAIWNENSVERFELRPKGGSLECAEKTIFLKGGKDFRPVAVDCDSRGNLFITDWVLVDYPNHGRGRIWKVTAKDNSNQLQPQPYFAEYRRDSASIQLEEIANATHEKDIVKWLSHPDAFVQHAVQLRMGGNPQFHGLIEKLKDHRDPVIRLAALLVGKRTEPAEVNRIRHFLSDQDTRVRQAALMWAGESMNGETLPFLRTALQVRPASAAVFEAYLATLQNLDGEFVKLFRSRSLKKSNDIPRRFDSEVLREIAMNAKASDELRAMAIARFDDDAVAAHWNWLVRQLERGSDVLALSAIRRVINAPTNRVEICDALSLTAESKARSSAIRCEALLALGTMEVPEAKRFIPLLIDENEDVSIEAARAFRAWLDAGHAVECVTALERLPLRPSVKLMLSYAKQGTLFGSHPLESRPHSNDEWHVVLDDGGSADRGRRVFRSGRVGCSTCHSVDGRGGVLGPDLSGVAQSKSRRQIIDAVLDPSADFPPQYQAWTVVTADGLTHRGLQLDHKSGGAIELITESGMKRRFEAQEIDEYAALPASLMPSGLPATMTVGEFRDLIAFLVSLQN